MSSRMWTRLVIGAGAAIVAVATGTAVIAAIDDRDDPPAVRQTLDAPAGDGADVAAICLEGATDCDDTIDSGGAAGGTCLEGTTDCVDTPGFEQCATDEPCGDFDSRCAADTACIEPWLMDPPVCPDGVSYEECFPDGTPEGWDCVQLESFPVQIRCYPIGCTPVDGPITILPAPAPGEPTIEEPLVDPIDPQLGEPGVAEGEPGVAEDEPVPPTIIECLPPVDCSVDPIPDPCLGSPCAISSRPDERCLPPECTVTEDGSIACPVPPPVECETKEDCLPPDCAISSDGAVYCPDPMPLPCPEVEGADGGCSSPGSCGDFGCESIVCPDDVSEEECKRLEEEMQSGGGASGSGGATDSIE
jgi:hypothetical protein